MQSRASHGTEAAQVSPIRDTGDTLEQEIAALRLERERAQRELRDIEYILGALIEERHVLETAE